MEFFCAKYANIFNYNSSKMDKLQEEFVDYQLLDRTDIPEAVWEESVVYEEEEGQEEKKQYHRMDNIWTYLSQTCQPIFAQTRDVVTINA